ncbi:uncharacterized protein LOC135103412 isoform X1 [Scylla paramamosain]|uniref:uncharacterized protein LOC135103412 isoform X1 n=1 Tax=Scylla paramamosain TaxID=85552 RepID=UPI0030828727
MARSRWILGWLLVLLLLTAGEGGNHSRSATESEVAQEFTPEGAAGVSGSSVNMVRSSPNAEKIKLYLVKQLLGKAEDLTKEYISATTAMNLPAGTVPKLELSGNTSEAGGRQWHLGTALSRFDLSFFNSNTSVDIINQVEEMVSLGLRSAQKMYMIEWRGRLILAVIEASGVSLYAIEPKTHRVQRTEGPTGRLSCNFAIVAGGHLVLTCIMADESKQHEKLGMERSTMKKVKVYIINENPMTPGRGALSYRFVHDIDVDSPRYIETWSQNKETFCVIISGEVMRRVSDRQVHFTRHTTSALYRWIGNHFDNWELLPGTSPVAAHHFMVNEFHYLAFANFQNNKGQHNCHSMIFRYYVDQGRYLPFQTVETRGAWHLQSFTLGRKRFQHTFLAIANFCEDTNTGTCNHHTISTIYHYDEGKFKPFQEIETSYAIQWMAVQVNMAVLIALVSKKGVTFYQYNGWKFVPTPVQPSHLPFSVGVTSLAATFWDGRLVLGVTNADKDKATGHPSLYSLSFTTRDDLEEVYYQLKELCEGLRRQTYGREVAELTRQAATTPRTTKPHTFPRRVTIKGNLRVQAASRATEVFSQGRRIPNGGGQTEARMEALEGTLEQARRRLSTMLPAAGPVAWPAHLHLANLMSAGTQVSSAAEVQALWINGESAPMLRHMVPLHAATRLRNLTLEQVEFKAPASVDHLHGKPIFTFITLNGHHEVSGNFIFQGPIKVQEVMVSNTLDGVKVDPRSLLLTTHAQTHAGSLKCQSLHSNTLDVAVVNDVAMDKLLSSLIIRSANITITGQLRVMGDIVYDGHLRVRDTRNLDLTNALLMKSLQKQVVFGGHQMSELEAPSMTTEGRLNTVQIPAEVFLNGSQHSYTVTSSSFSHVRATSASVLQKLNSITVTDGRLDVLLLSGYQIVTAPKSFTSLQLLEQNSPSYRSANTRHRRWSIGTCGSLKNRRPKTPNARIEALLLALRGVAAAQDLLSFLTEVQPGHFLVPLRTQLLFTLLKVDVNCAFIFLEDTERVMFFDIMTEDWRNEDNESVLVLSHQDLKMMVKEVMNYKMEMTNLLHGIQYRWYDIWLLISKALQKVDDIHDSLNVVRLLIDIIVSDDTMTPDISHHCQSVCGLQKDDDPLTLKCTRAALLTLRVAQRIARYPVIGSGMSQLSESQRMTFLKGAMQHDLGRLVEFLSTEEGLLPAVRAALPCGMVSLRPVIDNEHDILKMLEQYEKELLILSTYRDDQNDSPEGRERNYNSISPGVNIRERVSTEISTITSAIVKDGFIATQESLPNITKESSIATPESTKNPTTKESNTYTTVELYTTTGTEKLATGESTTATNDNPSTFTDEEASVLTTEQASALTNEEASTLTNEEASTLTNEEASTLTNEEASTFSNKEASTFTSEEASTFSNEEASTFTNEEASSFTNEEASTFTNEEASTFTNEEASTFTNEEASTFTNEEASTLTNEEASTLTNEEASTLTNEEASTLTNEEASTLTNEEASTLSTEEASTLSTEEASTLSTEEASTLSTEEASTISAEEASTISAEEASTFSAEEASTFSAEEASTLSTEEASTLSTEEASTLSTEEASTLSTEEASTLSTEEASTLSTEEASTISTEEASTLSTEEASTLSTEEASTLSTEEASTISTEEASSLSAEEAPILSAEEAPILSAEEAPTLSAEEAPILSAEEAPTLSAEEAPTLSAEEAPTFSAEEAPTFSAEEAPTLSAEEAPTLSAEEAPTLSAEEVPTLSAEEAPTLSAEEAPTLSAEEAPTLSAEEASTLSAEEAPTLSAEEVPTLSAEEAPTLSAEEAPTLSAEEVPTLSAEEAPTLSAEEAPTLSAEEAPTLSAEEASTLSAEEASTLYAEEAPTLYAEEAPSLSAEEAPSLSAEEAPTLSAEEAPTLSAEEASTVTHEEASTVTHEEASTVTHEEASTVTHEEASTVTHEEPSTVTHEEASTVTHEEASTTANMFSTVLISSEKSFPTASEEPFTEQPYTGVTVKVSTRSSHGSFTTHSLESSFDDSFPTHNSWSVQSPRTATPALPQMHVDPKLKGQTDNHNYGESITHTFRYVRDRNSNGSMPTSHRLMSEDWQRLKRELPHSVTGSALIASSILMVVSRTGNINSLSTEISLTQQNSHSVHSEYFSNLVPLKNIPNSDVYRVNSVYTPYLSFSNKIPASKTESGASLEVPKSLSKRRAEALVVPSAFHYVSVVKGNTGDVSHVTTVTLVQHLTTIINCTSCVFQYQIFQTTANHTLSAHLSASTVTHKTLTIMMSSSSTRIDCTNCAFQCHIFTTRETEAGWMPSSVHVTRSTIPGQGSATVIFPSSIPEPSYKFPHGSTISIQPTLYSARTFNAYSTTTEKSSAPSVSSQQPWTVSSGESKFESPHISVEPSREPSSFTPYIPSRPSDEKCDNIPAHYYVDSVRKDVLLAWLEAALLYFEEILSINPMVISEELERKPERIEITISLRKIYELMENTTKIVKLILKNLFYELEINELEISELNLILESEKFRTRMRTHLCFLNSFPDKVKKGLDEVKALAVLGKKRIILLLHCFGRNDWSYENEIEKAEVLWESEDDTDIPVSSRKDMNNQSGEATTDSHTLYITHGNTTTDCWLTSSDIMSPPMIGPTAPTIRDYDLSSWSAHYSTKSNDTTSDSVITNSESTTTSTIFSSSKTNWLTYSHVSVTPPFKPNGSSHGRAKQVTYGYNKITSIPNGTPISSEDAVPAPRPHTQTNPSKPPHREDNHGSWVVGRVAGHRLQDLVDRSFAHLPMRREAAFFIESNMARLNNITFKSGLRIQQLQGVDTGHLLRHGVPIHGSTIHANLTFTNPIQVGGPLRVSRVNGTLAASFVTLGGHHTLPHPFVFMGPITAAARVRVRNKINGLDLVLFSKSVALTSSATRQVLRHPINFTQVSAQRVFFATGRVRDVALEDLVPLGQPAIITGRKIFQDVKVREGETRTAALSVRYINDVNVTDLFANSLTTNPETKQVLSGPIMFMNLVVLGKLVTSRGLGAHSSSGMQSLRIDRIAAQVMYRDKDGKLEGNLLLKGRASVKDLTFRDSLDSVPAASYDSGWLLKATPQSFSGRVVLAGVRSGAVIVASGAKVQEVDISRLLTATIKVNEDAVVSFPMKLGENVWAARVRVSGAVQGWNLSSEAILQNSSGVVFVARKTFLGDFHVSGTLTAANLGGMAASSLCGEGSRKNLEIVGAVQLTSPVRTDTVHLGQHVLKKDTVDDYWLLNRHAILPHNMTFYKMTAHHIKADSVNGVDIVKLSTLLLRRTCRSGDHQVMTGRFFAPVLIVQSLFTPSVSTSRLNSRPLSDIHNLFIRNGQQTIKGHWMLQQVQSLESLITLGHANGIPMTDFCMIKKPCVITARKIFAHDLTVKRDLHVEAGRTVQGVDVSEALRQAVNAATCGHVPGVTTFTGKLTVPRLRVNGLVDGFKVSSKDVLTASGAQVMTGQMNIRKEGMVAVAGPSIRAEDGLFNRWNLSDHWRRGFRRGQDNIVREMVIFPNLAVFRNATENHRNLRRLSDQTGLARTNQNLNGLLGNAEQAISGVARELWGWRSLQTLRGTAARLVPLWMLDGSGGVPSSCPEYMAVISLSGYTRLLVYSSDQRKFINTGVVLRGGCTRAVAGYKTRGENYVITAHTCTGNSSHSTSTTIGSFHQGAAIQEAVQVWRITAHGPQHLQRIGIGALDVQVAEVGQRICLVVAVAIGNGTLVYCSSGSRGTFSGPRHLNTGCPKKISVVLHRDSRGRLMTLLAVVGQNRNALHDSALTLWLHDAEQDNFIQVEASEPAPAPSPYFGDKIKLGTTI